MKKTFVALVLALGLVLVLGTIGCEDLGGGTTLGPETTTTVAGPTTTTLASGATTTAGAATTTTVTLASISGGKPTTTAAMGVLVMKPQEKLLRGTNTWDVDNNVDGGGPNADLWYRISDELVHWLEPMNGAGLALITGRSFASVDRGVLQALSYSGDRLYTASVDDPDVLMVGSVIGLRTSTGQYAKLEVIGFEEANVGGMLIQRYSIRFRYVMYPR